MVLLPSAILLLPKSFSKSPISGGIVCNWCHQNPNVFTDHISKNPNIFFGHLLTFLQEPFGVAFSSWQKQVQIAKASYYRLLMGPSDFLVPKSESTISQIVGNAYQYQKPAKVQKIIQDRIGHSLITTEGDIHRVSSDGHFT